MKISYISILIYVQFLIIAANSVCIEVFEHKNFEGDKLNVCIENDSKCYNLNNEWNNRVSSINTHSRCVVLYQNSNCSGSHTKLFPGENGGDHFDLKTSNFDDSASSISLCGYLTQIGWYYLDGVDFAGSDLFYEKSSEIQCMKRCETDEKCKLIVMSSDGTQCWGKYYGDYGVWKNSERRAISNNYTELVREYGESYYGNDIAIIDNITENQCRDICGVHPKCTAANFVPSEQKCFIKNINPIHIDYNPNMIGLRDKDRECKTFNSRLTSSNLKTSSLDNGTTSIGLCRYLLPVTWYSLYEFDFVGSDLFYEKSSEIQCMKRCETDEKCKLIVISSDGTQCWGKYYGDYGVSKNHELRVISNNYRELVRKHGESYYGSDIAIIDNTSENQCIDICRIHPKCTAANFIPSEQKCFIKNMNPIRIHHDTTRIGLREKDKECINFNSSLTNSHLTSSKLKMNSFDNWITSIGSCRYLPPVVWYSLDGFDYWGSDLFHQYSNEALCMKRCETDEKCKFILVSSDGTHCWGKYYGDYQVLKSSERRAISNNYREFIHERGVDYYGNDIAIIDNISENQCRDICRIHPKCTAASFVLSEKKCYIKNMNPIRPYYALNINGIRLKHIDYISLNKSSKNSNLSVLKPLEKGFSIDGIDFAGSDGFILNLNETKCKKRCETDEKCKFIMVSSDGKQCWGKYYGDYGVWKNSERRAISNNYREFIRERAESYYGRNIAVIDNVNENDCMTICGIHPKCIAADFSQNDRKCSIKDKINQMDRINYDPHIIGIRLKIDLKDKTEENSLISIITIPFIIILSLLIIIVVLVIAYFKISKNKNRNRVEIGPTNNYDEANYVNPYLCENYDDFTQPNYYIEMLGPK